jgi:hypothetical protein
MSVAYASIIILLVAALNLMAEGAILRHAEKDRPKLGDKFILTGIILIVCAVIFSGVGFWFHFFPYKYIDPDLYLSVAMALGVPGCLTAIQGKALKEKQPNKLGQYLRWWAWAIVIIAVCLFAWAVVRSLINL